MLNCKITYSASIFKLMISVLIKTNKCDLFVTMGILATPHPRPYDLKYKAVATNC